MKRNPQRSILFALPLLLFLPLSLVQPVSSVEAGTFHYPEARRGDVTDDYHGTMVADPYRWLEDLDSDETRRWVDEESRLTEEYLAKIPAREEVRESLTKRWNYVRYGAPLRAGGRYFFRKNDGLQNQSVMYVQDTPGGEAKVAIDPNLFSEDGTVALSYLSVSHDGRYIAYGRAASGSDWETIHVRDLSTCEDLPDRLEWIKFVPATWAADGEGFYYCRYDAPSEGATYEETNRFPKIYYHALGTEQSADVLIHERPDAPELGFEPQVSDDGRFLVISVWQGSDERTRIHYIDLEKEPMKVIRLLDDFDAAYKYVGNTGTVFYFLTDLDAPNKRIIAVDIEHPQRERWRELVPEGEGVIKEAVVAGDRFVISSLVDVKGRVTVHRLDGTFVREVPLPETGSVRRLTGESAGGDCLFGFVSFTRPSTLYRFDIETNELSVLKASEIGVDPEVYVTKQEFYESRDGTRIPMFIVHRKGIPMDGSNPTYLYGYGGFNVILDPGFSITNLEWIDRGGIYAVPALRGGGEYGAKWHEAGMLANKQNVFDDFIAAAEYLIDRGYTSTPKLAIGGASNGGLLAGACLVQRPDLFGAVYVGVGVLDMLRFQKFTIGWAWTSDYGSSDDPEQFKYLYAYSPLHNVKPGVAYPPVMIATADHDDRVVPCHSFKFAAALQAAQAGEAPVLIRITKKAGHGAGKPTSLRIADATDRLAFFEKALGME